jgi:thiamine-monophosphate kinase
MRGATSPSTANKTGELAILKLIRRRAARADHSGIRVGIGDDCAVLRLKSREEATITTDLSVENRHFRLDWHPPESIGHRTLARGLSDLAAMGARPVAAFLSLGLPRKLAMSRGRARSWLDRFFDGFLSLAERSNIPLAGGDLAESPLALADIVLVGAVPYGSALLRSSARPGDLLYVTGSLGGSSAGLRTLGKMKSLKSARDARLTPHLWPEPRIREGEWLRKRGVATASIDISDGLSTDIAHLCSESGVSAEIDSGSLPLSPGATIEDALHGGEDYELLFTAPPKAVLPRAINGIPITRIGTVLKHRKDRPMVALVDGKEHRPLRPRGWEHFV